MSHTIQEILFACLSALSPAIVAILGWIALKIKDLVNANVKSKTLADALIRLDYAAINAVKYCEQTIVHDIRQAKDPNSPGGTDIIEIEAHEIQKNALIAARSFLGERGITELLAVFGVGQSKLDEVLVQRIEGAVHDLHTTDKAIAATADLPRYSIPPA